MAKQNIVSCDGCLSLVLLFRFSSSVHHLLATALSCGSLFMTVILILVFRAHRTVTSVFGTAALLTSCAMALFYPAFDLPAYFVIISTTAFCFA
ncbi:hypothetical protein AVEN_105697-1 [Araneus ventricosus]|uniref:Uncharacterized protein n=1 Tax=Araneus ventricosus TaxID=182803 RepID=A0A4Y2WG11_ARAVE|nr:hypothetical protein AVEN_105697-1 [Araneus ventricosus]